MTAVKLGQEILMLIILVSLIQDVPRVHWLALRIEQPRLWAQMRISWGTN